MPFLTADFLVIKPGTPRGVIMAASFKALLKAFKEVL